MGAVLNAKGEDEIGCEGKGSRGVKGRRKHSLEVAERKGAITRWRSGSVVIATEYADSIPDSKGETEQEMDWGEIGIGQGRDLERGSNLCRGMWLAPHAGVGVCSMRSRSKMALRLRALRRSPPCGVDVIGLPGGQNG